MRGLRSTLFLLVVAVALGAYIYFVESRRTPGEETKRDKVFSVEADKIEELQVRSAGGETTTLRKKDGTWEIVEPIAVKADESEVSGVTSNLASAEISRTIEEKAADLSAYGLAKPQVEVAFKTSGDADYRRLLVGEKTATGGDMYAKLASEPRVFLIPSYLETSFNRSTFDLRDKTLLAFDRDKADSIEIATGGRTVRAVKQGSEWTLQQPVAATADFSAVEGLLGRINTAQVKSIADQNPADLAKYGLAQPDATVSVGSGSSRATLLVGSRAEDGNIYAKDASRPMVVTVESSLVDELKKDPSELRRKDLFDFRPFNLTRLEIVRDGQTVAFEKAKGTEKDAQEKWRQVAPAAQDVDATKMDDLLGKLSNMRASSFVESRGNTGLDKPLLTVVARFDEGKKTERVELAKSGSDAYAARQGEPGAAKITTFDLDEVIRILDEMKKAPETKS
jgi:hypothetical protein